MEVAVIGAGITGLMAAYYLARDGHNVHVYEQDRYPAMHTSFANGGQISVSNSEVWTTWANVKKGTKWMFRKDAPLLVRPTFEWSKIKWLSKFLIHTIRGDYESNTVETIRMGLQSRELYKEIMAEELLEFDYSESGILHIYKDEEYFKQAEEAKNIYESNGCQWKILGPRQTARIDRALKHTRGIVGGAWTEDDSVGDIHMFCFELAQILKKKYKVKFTFDRKIDRIDEEFDHYDKVVVSGGIGSNRIARSIGDELNIYPIKGYSITINNVDPKLLPTVSVLDDQAKIVSSTLGNRLRVAGTAELAGENYDIRRDRIEPLLKWVHENFPKIDTRDYTSWACLRPMTPNMMPIVRQSEKNNKVFYHTGHGHLGWTVSPATAVKLVDMIGKTT